MSGKNIDRRGENGHWGQLREENLLTADWKKCDVDQMCSSKVLTSVQRSAF